MESPRFTSFTPAEALDRFADSIIQQAAEDSKADESWVEDILKEDLRMQVNELRMWSRSTKGSGIRAVKVSGIIKASPKLVFSFFSNMTDSTKKEYDTNLIECATFREDSKEIKIQRLRYSAPYPIYPREFVVLRVDKQIGDSFYLFSSSVEYDSCPTTNKYVRGDMRVSGLIIKPCENGRECRLTKIVQIDPRGSIPAFAVNMISYKQAEYFVTLNAMFSERARRKFTV